jgi:hypothetical protein
MPGSLTLFVRHELEPDRRRELAEAGVAVVVDARAPSCSIAAGAGSRLDTCPSCAALDRELASRANRVSLELFGRARAARARRHD